jgi:hypothetical protein
MYSTKVALPKAFVGYDNVEPLTAKVILTPLAVVMVGL